MKHKLKEGGGEVGQTRDPPPSQKQRVLQKNLSQEPFWQVQASSHKGQVLQTFRHGDSWRIWAEQTVLEKLRLAGETAHKTMETIKPHTGKAESGHIYGGLVSDVTKRELFPNLELPCLFMAPTIFLSVLVLTAEVKKESKQPRFLCVNTVPPITS